MNSITLCNINKLFQNGYVFIDEEGIYYLWQIYFSDFRATLEIVAFRKEGNKFGRDGDNKG